MQVQLQSLLNQVSAIIEEEKKLRQRKYDSGETFNVFEVLRLQRDEVRLHSSFIAALLDPKGPHGLKSKPLELFQSGNTKQIRTTSPSPSPKSPDYSLS